MGVARILVNFLVVLAAIAAGLYQFKLKPFLTVVGAFREVDPIGTRDCITVPELAACESKLDVQFPSIQPLTLFAFRYRTRYSPTDWCHLPRVLHPSKSDEVVPEPTIFRRVRSICRLRRNI